MWVFVLQETLGVVGTCVECSVEFSALRLKLPPNMAHFLFMEWRVSTPKKLRKRARESENPGREGGITGTASWT